MTSSPAILAALSQWRAARAEYELVREAAFHAAHEACHGALLNARGKAHGIDPYSLFMGPQVRADAYASEELRNWWRHHPRVTFAQYERTVSPVSGHEWGQVTAAGW